jgi:hypothetical protein
MAMYKLGSVNSIENKESFFFPIHNGGPS